VALISEGLQLTYEEVSRMANTLAASLTKLGAGPERRIGIMLDRSASLCVALLAVLKTGAAYVPVDSTFPDRRPELMLEAVEILLTQNSYLERIGTLGQQPGQVLCIDESEGSIPVEGRAKSSANARAEAGARSSANAQAEACATDPDNLVYVIFTSGS